MTISRRQLLEYGALVAGTRFITPPSLRALQGPAATTLTRNPYAWHHPDKIVNTDIMLALAKRAVDAAMASGASYADVRLTHTLTEVYTSGSFGNLRAGDLRSPEDFPTRGFLNNRNDITFGGTPSNPFQFGVGDRPQEIIGVPTLVMGLGVRAFAHGYWGFAASPYWTDADATRLGQDAAMQATQNARAGKTRPADLGTIPRVTNGRWVQPGIDPFTVPIDEKLDVLRSLLELPAQGNQMVSTDFGLQISLSLWREARVFASSEGASYYQVRYRCAPQGLTVGLHSDELRGEPDVTWQYTWSADALSACGWERVRNLDQDHLAQTMMEHLRVRRTELPIGNKPVEIGKYDVVFSATSAAQLVYQTLGVATELDRALGYEANAEGTSYLGPDPMQYLGTAIASPHVNLTADRTTPHALATAKWDDEGVLCSAFPLIKNGILVDYQTTREQAHWLEDWYTKNGMPVQSHACAVAETALDCPIQMSPNFTLEPGAEAVDIDDLIKDTERGIYFPGGGAQVDQQVKNGIWRLNSRDSNGPREIRNGKLGSVLIGAAVLFNSQELWKHVTALGGTASARDIQAGERKGEPAQRGHCNVRAVPMKVTDCAIIDATRKA
jgi:TldD protein